MKGFFAASDFLGEPPPPTVAQCGQCQLHKKCRSPKIQPTGSGRRSILFVGEAPGEEEDDKGKPFVGKAGRLLRTTLAGLDIDLDDCRVTNTLICRPPHNEKPTRQQAGFCRPNLTKEINEWEPTVIIPLGEPATDTVVQPYWFDAAESMARWAGLQIPLQPLNCWICPTYHPSFVARQEDKPNGRLVAKVFRDHLQAAVAKTDRPWDVVPDWPKEVRKVYKPSEVEKILLGLSKRKDIEVSFDYETNMLKPEPEEARIYSCAVTWGPKMSQPSGTIAYPWQGAAREATGRLLRSPVPKIGANLRFENRWTEMEFGHMVRRWVWDVVPGAHWSDNRRKASSLKFRSFVELGMPIYNRKVDRFLDSADHSQAPNRIEDISLDTLLVYNGLDSLLAWHLALKQRRLYLKAK